MTFRLFTTAMEPLLSSLQRAFDIFPFHVAVF